MRGLGFPAWPVTLLLTLWSAAANAGCPNPCELTVEPAELSPALECLSSTTRPGGCKCELSLSLHNACDVPVDAVDFEFTSCLNPAANEFEQPCYTVEPQHVGMYQKSYDEVGAQQSEITLSIDGEQYTVSLAANVTEFNDGCGCSVPSSGGTAVPALIGSLLLVLRRRHGDAWRKRRCRTLVDG